MCSLRSKPLSWEVKMTRLQVGQKFKFTKIQSGIIYYRENDGLGPYAVPARYYQGLIEDGNFIDHRGFAGSEVFEVVEAYITCRGWHVIGKIKGENIRVSFYQKLDLEGSQFAEIIVH